MKNKRIVISKNKIKYISSLEHKKARRNGCAFVAEGPKVVSDLLSEGFKPQFLVATNEWMPDLQITDTEILRCDYEELRKISFLQHPQQVIGVFDLPQDSALPSADWFNENLCLMLDGVQDPGNLGTIIRVADWFGINTIICSPTTADAFAPKVVQATMGSIARVRIIYTDIEELLKTLPHSIPIYGTLLDGDNIYKANLKSNGIIIMGNEGNGISIPVRKHITDKLLIPSFPPNKPTAESLNVAIATSIVCAEFRRNQGV